MIHHVNDGKCERCFDIFSAYPGFFAPLWEWFETFQESYPEFHISCAGRGRKDQESAFDRGVSRAHYGQSAHNFNAAIDLFVITPGSEDLYPKGEFIEKLKPEIDEKPEFCWYGQAGAEYYELPHIEVTDWEEMVDSGALRIVE